MQKTIRNAPRAPIKPGDQSAPGTLGSGENLCPACQGSGICNGTTCTTCGGTGKVIEGIGGG